MRERETGGRERETSAIICLDYGANVTSLEVLQNAEFPYTGEKKNSGKSVAKICNNM